MDYLEIANGPILLLLCALTIGVVAVQAIIFVWMAWRRGQEIGLTKHVMRRTMTNSALFSIVPSMPIIVMMLALSQALGRYFPWLRLSVVGSAAYEGMAADLAAQSMGLEGFTDPDMTPKIYVVIMFVMTVGIVWGILFNIFFKIGRAHV